MRFIDFFSGIGGFRLGMEIAGHTCVGHCEIDKYANESYVAMHDPKDSEWYAADIRTVEHMDLPEAEVYCFGFPCQSFSIAGSRHGFGRTEGTLFFEVMRLAKERQPKLLFAENVKGLLSHDNGETFQTIIETMGELGYSVEWQVLDSRDFGLPQARERLFIIGHSRKWGGAKPIFPLTAESCRDRLAIKQIGRIPQRNRDNPNAYRVYDQNGAAPCLNCMTGGGRQPYIVDKGTVRRLTPKECFRLQGFPDEHFERARAVNSDTQLYKQAGNSVSVSVIYEIARRLE